MTRRRCLYLLLTALSGLALCALTLAICYVMVVIPVDAMQTLTRRSGGLLSRSGYQLVLNEDRQARIIARDRRNITKMTVSSSDRTLVWVPLDFDADSALPRPSRGRSPIYMLSAYYDTRPLLFGRWPRLVTVGAVNLTSYPAKDDKNIWWRRPQALSCMIGRRTRRSVEDEHENPLELIFQAPAEVELLPSSRTGSIMTVLLTCNTGAMHLKMALAETAGADLYITYLPNLDMPVNVDSLDMTFEERYIRVSSLSGHPYPPLLRSDATGGIRFSDYVNPFTEQPVTTPPVRICQITNQTSEISRAWIEHQNILGASSILEYASARPNEHLRELVFDRVQIVSSNDSMWISAVEASTVRVRAHFAWWTRTPTTALSHVPDDSSRFIYSIRYPGESMPVQWDYPNFDLSEFGSAPAQQDCILRSVGQFRWVTTMNTTEFFVPRTTNTYSEFLQHEISAYYRQPTFSDDKKSKAPLVGAISVRIAQFCRSCRPRNKSTSPLNLTVAPVAPLQFQHRVMNQENRQLLFVDPILTYAQNGDEVTATFSVFGPRTDECRRAWWRRQFVLEHLEKEHHLSEFREIFDELKLNTSTADLLKNASVRTTRALQWWQSQVMETGTEETDIFNRLFNGCPTTRRSDSKIREFLPPRLGLIQARPAVAMVHYHKELGPSQSREKLILDSSLAYRFGSRLLERLNRQ